MRNTVFLLTVLVAFAGCAAVIGDDELAAGLDPPPAIAITAPVGGTTVSRVVQVSSTVSSTTGATSVHFEFPDRVSVTDTAPPFSVDWDSTTVPDGSYPILATVTDARAAPVTTSVTIVVANRGCVGRFVAEGLPRVIPDDSPAGIAPSLEITDDASVDSLSLSLRITHPFPPDLRMVLISPGGAQYPLTSLTSRSSAPDVMVDDEVISAFNGQRAAGTWTLAIRDVAPGDVGRLEAWSLSITGSCRPGAQ